MFRSIFDGHELNLFYSIKQKNQKEKIIDSDSDV